MHGSSRFGLLWLSLGLVAGALLPHASVAATLKQEVDYCKAILGFTAMPEATNCFAPGAKKFDSPRNGPSRLIHLKLEEQVDAVLHCENVDEVNRKLSTESSQRGAVVLTIHNRNTGNTCFFDHVASEDDGGSSVIPSLDTANAGLSGDADKYWFAGFPSSRCRECHTAGGPFLIDGSAHAMQVFGLINNGHDTNDKKYSFVSFYSLERYLAGQDTMPGIFKNPTPTNASTTCGLSCHNFDTGPSPDSQNPLFAIAERFKSDETMPPWSDSSDFRWANLDSPTNTVPSAGVESERFVDAINSTNMKVVAELFGQNNPNCPQPSSVPSLLEAHIVGSENNVLINQTGRYAFLPDRLAVFNLKDGLICLNNDQDPGQRCQDYRVRYECTNSTGEQTWSNYVMHDLRGDGDHEERPANVCPADSKATGIEAAFTHPVNGWTYTAIGPHDRLANFSPYGLTCNSADQPDGKCSDYVVNYRTCVAPPTIQSNKTLTNVFAAGKQLTAASGSLVKGQPLNSSWNTQKWSIEPVKNTEFVRLRSPGLNVYLTVASASESATVGTAASNGTTNQMWLIEPVSGSADIRLKNVYSGKYLTMADPKSFTSTPNYLPVFSQTRNTSWTSQRWIVQ